MNRTGLISATVSELRENGIRKSVKVPKQVLHISDDSGNHRDFYVKGEDKQVIYTANDVDAILRALLDVIKDSLKHGESVTIHSFGSLRVQYRKPRKTRAFDTGEEIIVPGRYILKFFCGAELKMCAKLYELSVKSKEPPESIQQYNDEDNAEDDDDDDSDMIDEDDIDETEVGDGS